MNDLFSQINRNKVYENGFQKEPVPLERTRVVQILNDIVSLIINGFFNRIKGHNFRIVVNIHFPFF